MVPHEPEIAIAASPRDWGQRLHRHVADHGGARVRATVLQPHDALLERYDVLIVDDTTSFLTRRLVTDLHRLGRRILGVYDPDDPRGKGELVDLDVDRILERTATAEAFLEAIAALAPPAHAGAGDRLVVAGGDGGGDGAAGAQQRRGRIVVVGGPGGGCGVTEVAVGMATALGRRGDGCVVVDADEVEPSLAQRLGLPLYPNLRTAVDAVEHHEGSLAEALLPVPAGGFSAVVGLAQAKDWVTLRAPEVANLVRQLAFDVGEVLVNAGPRIEDLSRAGGPARYAQSRLLLSGADAIVGVTAPTPVGVTRLLAWTAEVRVIAGAAPLHLVVNRAGAGAFHRGEIATELRNCVQAESLTFLPADARVTAAAWAGEPVTGGPFSRGVHDLTEAVLPAVRKGGRRRWPRPLRRRRPPADSEPQPSASGGAAR